MKSLYLFLLLAALACLLPAQNAPLTLTAPNGGEEWAIGSTNAITWTQTNLAGPMSIWLMGANDPAVQNLLIAQAVPVTAGSFSWTIPPLVQPGTSYRVRIALPNAAGMLIQDFSDGPFTISGGTPPPPPPPQTFIHVLSPNGGEHWAPGSTQAITWDYGNLEGEVIISLIQPNNDVNIVLAPAVPINAESFAWTIPVDFPPGMYKVHIVWLSILTVYFGDLSDNWFTVTGSTPPPPPPPPALKLTSPNGGESWQAGSSHPITWDYSGNPGFVQLQLQGGPEMSPINIIAPQVPANPGVFLWHIPPYQMPLDAYTVRVSLLTPNGTVLEDMSDAPFAITAPTPDSSLITVTAPNGGEQWIKGSTQTITWTDEEYTGHVRIFLIRTQNRFQHRFLIARRAPNTGSFSWRIPLRAIPGDNYKIQVVKLGGGRDLSDDFFSILQTPANLKAVSTPAGTRISFTLSTAAPASVKIYNLRGQCVRVLLDKQTVNGAQVLLWDGKDRSGRKVADGVYFARITSPELNATQRLIIRK